MSLRKFFPFSPKNQTSDITLVLPLRLMSHSKPCSLISIFAIRISLGQLQDLVSNKKFMINCCCLLRLLGFLAFAVTRLVFPDQADLSRRDMSWATIFFTSPWKSVFGSQLSSVLAGVESPINKSTSAGL